jgi:outer membrane murein-binding lipoprotein Lpp
MVDFGSPINLDQAGWEHTSRARFRAEISRLRSEVAALRAEVQVAKAATPDTKLLAKLKAVENEFEQMRRDVLAVLGPALNRANKP